MFFSYAIYRYMYMYSMCIIKIYDLLHFSSALRVPVLVKHPKERGKVLANFDPIIFQLIRETDVMMKLGLEVPEEGQMLMCMEKRLKDLHQQLIVSFFLIIFSILSTQSNI